MEKYIFTGILIATLFSMVDHRAPLSQKPQPIPPATQQAMTVGQQIQLARIRKGFSQKYLARLTGVDLEKIQIIEKENVIPSVNELYLIQEILGGGIIINGDAMARL